jgi:protein-L-isoaspartate O-methyltransferase
VNRYTPSVLLDPMLKVTSARFQRAQGYDAFVSLKAAGGPLPDDGRAELAAYTNIILGFDNRNPKAIDLAHNLFLIGAVLAFKPRRLLELGIGTGYVTASLAHAVRYNQVGQLTSVDSWLDTGGKEPEMAAGLRALGVNIVRSGEEEFVRSAPTDAFDILVSDADHERSPQWLDQHMRITRRGGLMFFHDTNQPQIYPALATMESKVAALGLPYIHFKEGTRPGELCNRGWLFAINQKTPS